MTIAGDVDAVEKLVRDKLGEPSLWVEPDGYRDSLALCAIDSVYSLQSHYTATIHVLDRYRTHRREQGGDPNKDGAPELLAAIQHVGGPAAAADDLFRNRANAPGTKRLKSESLVEAVGRLLDIGVETTAHLRSADTSDARRRLQRNASDRRSAPSTTRSGSTSGRSGRDEHVARSSCETYRCSADRGDRSRPCAGYQRVSEFAHRPPSCQS
jgi:hypothetical protein